MKMTHSEIYFCANFAKDMIGNIDNKDFYDGRNDTRNPVKVFEDNLKGKLAELHVFNRLGDKGLIGEMDFAIYEKGIGDDFDIIVNNKSIDVKASTPAAKCLIVEETKIKTWKDNGKFPDYLCMVAVSEVGDSWETKYAFGITWEAFKKSAKWYDRGDTIPNTMVKLKAKNAIVTQEDCGKIDDLMYFITNGDTPPF